MSKNTALAFGTTINPATVGLGWAAQAIAIKKQQNILAEQFKAPQAALIQLAGGGTLTIEVPGEGKVTVTKPSDAVLTGETGYRFEPKKFASLSPALKKKLLEAGVVQAYDIATGGAAASVRVVPNA